LAGIDARSTRLVSKRGEVYLVQLDKPRPAIVLSVDPLNKFALDVCVVAVTSVEHGKFSMRVPIQEGRCQFKFQLLGKVRPGYDPREEPAQVSANRRPLDSGPQQD